ncbi:hypothetical protein [Noviherbaspirillum saxi]|uniref:Sodium:proline symporter n=1 Tax=Noviherbaspirillum saxi TaxID=2320863 RepID=A0A3A3FMI1_9BURK|nr:hypothetical protein [Noviherbaspirillum saxi]RJF97427.1 hypothetical protein D3871_01930 [Noviherbaspirillum saxi]
MELHLNMRRWHAHAPDWKAAVAAGLVAGAVLMVLELLWSTTTLGKSPWEVSHMVAAIIMGQGVLQSFDFNVGVITVALITHYLLGVLFAIVFATIVASMQMDRNPGMALFAGAVFGLLLYLFNFFVMVRLFPWFEEMRGWAAVMGHLLFGMVASGMYLRLEEHPPTT